MTLPESERTHAFSSDSVAVILAATVGTRLFPLTSLDLPKHLLPLAGVPTLLRLLHQVQAAGFVECVIAIAQDDRVTAPLLRNTVGSGMSQGDAADEQVTFVLQAAPSSSSSSSSSSLLPLKIIVLPLEEECSGSAQALAFVERANIIDNKSHIVVLPGDAVVLQAEDLSKLARIAQDPQHGNVACVMLLSDEGQVDEHGIPLKESAKQKKGNLARDEEDIEYIALSFKSSSSSSSAAGPAGYAPRVVWKQAKLEVEQDVNMTSATPKLMLPKPRLRHGITKVRTDWNDVHVYALAPWVRTLVTARTSLVSLQGDLIPLLVARQFRGVKCTFGSSVDAKVIEEATEEVKRTAFRAGLGNVDENQRDMPVVTSPTNAGSDKEEGRHSDEYSVLALVKNAVERAHSIPGYMHATKQLMSQIIESPRQVDSLLLPKESTVNTKFCTILLPGATMGAKVNMKGSVIGSAGRVGDKCRLNNVVVLDNVTIGDNTILQNSIIGAGCQIGENCNLNDCQVAAGRVIPAGTKEKGESFIAE